MKLVASAIRLEDGTVLTGRRHNNIIQDPKNKQLAEAGVFKRRSSEQGFVDEDGGFYSRYQAARVAFRMGQIKEMKRELTSEDVW